MAPENGPASVGELSLIWNECLRVCVRALVHMYSKLTSPPLNEATSLIRTLWLVPRTA